MTTDSPFEGYKVLWEVGLDWRILFGDWKIHRATVPGPRNSAARFLSFQWVHNLIGLMETLGGDLGYNENSYKLILCQKKY